MQRVSPGGGPLRNILLTITYDGSRFHGWQIQQNAPSVQQAFQEALFQVIGNEFEIKGCSRTDSGVHAYMYCVSVKTAHRIPAPRLKAALNRFLPRSVAVLDAKDVPDSFHARYSCKGKEYLYKIWNSGTRNPFLEGYALHYRYPLDVELLQRAARAYTGTHDFTSFCTLDKREKGDFTRTVRHFTVTRKEDMVYMRVEADGFLYNMVRIMVGTLLAVAQGKIPEDAIAGILEAKNREKAGPTAPACGLYLNRVYYEKEYANG